MIYSKIPRKLKKRLKKIALDNHSESYKKIKRLTSRTIRIRYYETTNDEIIFRI